MKWRLWMVLGAVLIAYGTLGFNLYNLQIRKSDYYSARAASQFKGFLSARRGNINLTDKNGNSIPVAITKKFPVIFAVPKEVSDAKEAAATLAPILSLETKKLEKMLSKPGDTYEELVEKATNEEVSQVKALKLAGLYVSEEEKRFYPFNELAAQVLGFVGPSKDDDESKGRYGLERQYESLLRGQNGKIENDVISEAIQGEEVNLTIDRNIQARAEEILEDLIKKQAAKGGVVIVQEPATGKILAMAGSPGFDPNHYSTSPLSSFLNPAVQGIYEPGSIFKIFTMAAGLDAGKILPETKFNDTGTLTLNGRTISNWDHKAHGTVTMTEVIEQSINTGAAFAEQKTGHDVFYKYLEAFQVEEPTGITLPGELKGSLRNLKNNWRAINFATASFGQGVAVTPLRLITMVSAIANNGILMKPLLVSDEAPVRVRRVVGEKAAKEVTQMMVSAVTNAKVAKINGYQVAGKTGTAQIPDPKTKGYKENQFIHSYAGFAPASAPKFTILFKLDEPQNDLLAGTTVVPAFRELAEFILNYYAIPPDNVNSSH